MLFNGLLCFQDTVFIEGLQVVTQVARNQFLLEFGEHSQALVAVKVGRNTF